MAWQLWALALLGLVGKCEPVVSEVGTRQSRANWLWLRLGLLLYLRAGFCFHSSKSCLYASNLPMCASLKCISCKTVEESYLLLPHKAFISCFQMHKKVFKKNTCSQEDITFLGNHSPEKKTNVIHQ